MCPVPRLPPADVVFLSGVPHWFWQLWRLAEGPVRHRSRRHRGCRSSCARWCSGSRRGSRLVRKRAPDLGRCSLPRPTRRPPDRTADRDTGGHGQSALRVRLRSRGSGGAADPPGRVRGGAGRGNREYESGPARGARRAVGAPPRSSASPGRRSLGGAARPAVRTLHGRNGGEAGPSDRIGRRRWTVSRR